MKFVSARVEAEWNSPKLNPKVKAIVIGAAQYALDIWDWEFTLTAVHRTLIEEKELKSSGVHNAWRAVDVRTRDQKPEAVKDVTAYINGKWTYDPKRPAKLVCFSEPHGTGPHAHIQVHTNTVEAIHAKHS